MTTSIRDAVPKHIRTALLFLTSIWLLSPMGFGQMQTLGPSTPIFHDGMPTGVIGRAQLQRDWRLRGALQAVELSGPSGLEVSIAQGGDFFPPESMPNRVAMLVGSAYRLKIIGIPGHPGEELYPTLEIIDRTYPPANREHRFPVPVVFELNDLEDALNGGLVTRVIYVEDNQIAQPVSYADGLQRVYDVGGADDALRAADRMGRPVAILRIGSRVPENNAFELHDFCFGFPDWAPIKPIPNRQEMVERGQWPDIEYAPLSPTNDSQARIHSQDRPQSERADPIKLGRNANRSVTVSPETTRQHPSDSDVQSTFDRRRLERILPTQPSKILPPIVHESTIDAEPRVEIAKKPF